MRDGQAGIVGLTADVKLLQVETGNGIGVVGVKPDRGAVGPDRLHIADIKIRQLVLQMCARRINGLGGDALVIAKDGIERARRADLIRPQIFGAEIIGVEFGVIRFAVDDDFEIRPALRGFGRAQHAARLDAGQVVDQEQAAFHVADIQGTFGGDLLRISLDLGAGLGLAVVDSDMVDIAFDHLEFGIAAADRLRRDHDLGQDIAVIAILFGDGVGDRIKIDQRYFLADFGGVERLQFRLAVNGHARDVDAFQHENDFFGSLRRGLAGHVPDLDLRLDGFRKGRGLDLVADPARICNARLRAWHDLRHGRRAQSGGKHNSHCASAHATGS